VQLALFLLQGARIAISRLGTGGDTTKRILGGGVVNRFETRLKPIAAFLDSAGSADRTPGAPKADSKWIGGGLARLIVRRAKLTESTMRLLVLGLVKDAERFTVNNQAATIVAPVTPPKPKAS